MKRPRWKLRDMLLVAPAAGLLVALTPGVLRQFDLLGAKADPTLIVAPIVFGSMTAFLLIAALGASYGKPSRRAFRFGFVVVATSYFMLASSSWTGTIAAGLLTTQATGDLAARVRQEISPIGMLTRR